MAACDCPGAIDGFSAPDFASDGEQHHVVAGGEDRCNFPSYHEALEEVLRGARQPRIIGAVPREGLFSKISKLQDPEASFWLQQRERALALHMACDTVCRRAIFAGGAHQG